MTESKFCPFLDLNEKKCRAVTLVAGPKAFKPHTHMDLTENDVEKCKTIWKSCPIYVAEAIRRSKTS